MNVGIIGCGSIGRTLASALEEMDGVGEVLIIDSSMECSHKLAHKLVKVRPARDFDELLAGSDIVVEAASQGAVVQYGEKALSAGKDLMILSIGALADDAFREKLFELAHLKGRNVYLPSGALAGIDGLFSASSARIDSVELTTTKPPSSLLDASGEQGFDLTDIQGTLVLFEGTARESVRRFPKNVNVAAVLSLAGIGFDQTRVRLVADPAATCNTHRLRVRGEFGELEVTVSNQPFPDNPRTSYLAALSAVAMLRSIVSGIHIGV